MAGECVRTRPARIVIFCELMHRGNKLIAPVPVLAQLRPHGVCQFVERRFVLYSLESHQTLIGVPVAASRTVVQIDNLEIDVVPQPVLCLSGKGISIKNLVQKGSGIPRSRWRELVVR
jgi:hypothetical protein